MEYLLLIEFHNTMHIIDISQFKNDIYTRTYFHASLILKSKIYFDNSSTYFGNVSHDDFAGFCFPRPWFSCE